MRKSCSDRGFSMLELLFVICIIAICAAIAIPVLKRSESTRVNGEFKRHFGFSLLEFTDNEFSKPNEWLTPEQKNLIRPFVRQRIHELCSTASDEQARLEQRKADLWTRPPPDSSTVRERLKELAELDEQIKRLRDSGGSGRSCSRAEEVAGNLDLLTEEK